jgi:aminopeptidase
MLRRRRQAHVRGDRGAGGNKSMIHIDWMIGSEMIDIDGLGANGDRTPVFRKGEWA